MGNIQRNRFNFKLTGSIVMSFALELLKLKILLDK